MVHYKIPNIKIQIPKSKFQIPNKFQKSNYKFKIKIKKQIDQKDLFIF